MTPPLPKLFVIGSSTTVIFGPYLKAMVAGVYDYSRKGDEPDELRKAFRDLDAPQGASAGDSAMVVEYLRSLDRAGGLQADVVLLHVGLHDIKVNRATGRKQVPLADYRRNVETIVAWFRRHHLRLIWLCGGPLDEALHNERCRGFQRFEKDLAEYNAAAEAILAREGVPILDLAGFTRRLGPLSETLKDHIHFKDDIVRQQAAFIAGCLTGRLMAP